MQSASSERIHEQTKTPKQETASSITTKLIVAAIDFGTTYSGYAYSLKHDFDKDPFRIFANEGPDGGQEKMPTTIIFTPDGKFHSFGHEAEKKYAKLAGDAKHVDLFYFSRFKMKLHTQQKIRRHMELIDERGHKMRAMKVFAEAIKYLKSQLLNSLEKAYSDINDTDIHWVITVPAIWDDGAKQFMREAGKQAGIPDNQLNLALEPEVAAIYCKTIPMKKDGTSLEPGTQFILADLGGGTVDITVHAIDVSGNLTELHPPSGGPWGGTKVDAEFNTLLEKIFGKSVISSFNKNNKDDVLYLMQDFENKKREFKAEDDEVTFRVPCTLIEALKSSGRTLEENLYGTMYEGKVKQKGDKMKIEGSIMAGLFYDAERNIIQLIRDLLTQHPKVNKILMVGGFSESNIIQQAVKKAFPEKIIIPKEARLAVLKGAVMYGHNLSVIISRSSPYTYGISVAVPFDDSKHPESKKEYKDGSYKCESNFKVFIRAGEMVVPGETTVRHVCNASSATSASVEIYRTKSNNPTYVDDRGCSCVGSIELQLSDTTNYTIRPIEITMFFGSTELTVQAKEEKNNKNAVVAKFNFLH